MKADTNAHVALKTNPIKNRASMFADRAGMLNANLSRRNKPNGINPIKIAHVYDIPVLSRLFI
jgi:hypothetical protein